MNTVKIYLNPSASGSTARVDIDFRIFKGSYRNKLIDLYIPKTLLYSNNQGTYMNAVKVGAILTAEDGERVSTQGYYANYMRDENVLGVNYSVYELTMPNTFTTAVGEQTIVVNVVNVNVNNYVETNVLSYVETEVTEFTTGTYYVLSGEDEYTAVVLPDQYDAEETYYRQVVATGIYFTRSGEEGNYSYNRVELPRDYESEEVYYRQVPVVMEIMTSQTCKFTVLESYYLSEDEPIDPTELEIVNARLNDVEQDIDSLQDELDVAEIDIQNNANAIAQNAEDIAEIKSTFSQGENYIGTITSTSAPIVQGQVPNAIKTVLTNYVQSQVGRLPKVGDTIIYVYELSDDTDQNYKMIYGTDWTGFEIPPMELAGNGTSGLVEGTYNVGDTSNTLVDIVGGKIKNIYIKQGQAYTNIYTWLNALQLEADATDSELLALSTGLSNGTVIVKKAYEDENGNNIVSTYMTQNAGATKQYVKDYALSKVFNDVYYITADGYTEVVPDDVDPQFSVTTSTIGETQIFQLNRTTTAQYELSNKNSCDTKIWVNASRSCDVVFRLKTEAYVDEEWHTLRTELSNTISLSADEIQQISFGSSFVDLGNTVLSIVEGDVIRQTLTVITEHSQSTVFEVYSNETYPSTFTLETQSVIQIYGTGELGEQRVYSAIGTLSNGLITFELTSGSVINLNTEAEFKLSYNGALSLDDEVILSLDGEDYRIATNNNVVSGNATISDLMSSQYYNVGTTHYWIFKGFIELQGANTIVRIIGGSDIHNIEDGATTGIQQSGYAIAKGSNSAAFNSGIARGTNSFAMTAGIAKGTHSHSEGEFSVAEGWASHAEGGETFASHSCQHVEGIANKGKQLTMHEVGNGRFSFILVSPKPTYSVACNFGADGNTYYFAAIQGGGHHLITEKRYTEEQYNALDNVYTMQRDGQNIFEVYQYGSLSNGVHVEDLKLFMLAFLAQTVSGGTITMEAAITQGYDYCVTAMTPYLDQLKGYLATLYPQAATLISSVTTVDELMTLLVTLIFGQNNIADNYVISPLSFLNGMNNKTYSLATLLSGYGNTIGATDDIVCGTASGALGVNNTVKGQNSLAVGDGNTIQRANGSAAFGNGNVVDSNSNSATIVNAFAIGNFLKNYYSRSLAIGYYNDDDTSGGTEKIFQVGNGTGDNARSNAFEVLADGTARVFGTPTGNYDVTNKNYVDSAISRIPSIEFGIARL